jgi:hypothetical protein
MKADIQECTNMALGLVQVSFRFTSALMKTDSVEFVIDLQLFNYILQGVREHSYRPVW